MAEEEGAAKRRATSKTLELRVKQIVARSRLALGLPDVNREVIDATAAEIVVLLDDGIDEGNIEQVYLNAMRAKENSFALSYVDLNAAWRSMSQIKRAEPGMKCPGCAVFEEDPKSPCPIHGKGVY